MRQHSIVVQLCNPRCTQLEARRVTALLIPQLYKRSNLIHRHKPMHAIRQFTRNISGIIGERPRGIAAFPSTLILQRLRQIPVIQRAEWFYAICKQLIDDAAVKIDSLRIRVSAAIRKDPRPRNRESIAAQPQALHQRDVLLVPVVVVDRYIAGISTSHSSGQMAECIPDGWTATILVNSSLNLVRGRR